MLQAKGYETSTSTTGGYRSRDSETTPFPYGWRYVKKLLPSGVETYEQIPLTAFDLLNPQEGDQVPQSNEHFRTVVDLVSILRHHYDAKVPVLGVFGDLIMDWGIPGLATPAPDIALIPNVKDRDFVGGRFKVVEQGSRPCLVMEVMSPGYPGDDTDKVNIYEQAGIAEYFLIKPRIKHGVPHYQLGGYRLTDGVYQSILPKSNPWGQVLTSQTLQLQFEVVDQGRQIKVTDLQTGKPLPTPAEIEAARQQEHLARVAAETARLAAETAQQQEYAARLAAEARADAEARARAEEAKARAALELRLQELEKLLQSRT